jgi:hypothetical protein
VRPFLHSLQSSTYCGGDWADHVALFFWGAHRDPAERIVSFAFLHFLPLFTLVVDLAAMYRSSCPENAKIKIKIAHKLRKTSMYQ